MSLRGLIRSLAALLPCAALATTAHAQGTGRSLDLDPSTRASGMGRASNAVFWDEATNQWGNPALLGYQRGVSYEWGRTRLVPGLAADVHFTTNVVKLGGAGIGVALAGKPGIGGMHLSYGESEVTDDQGNPIGTFESFEDVDAWSFGISAARLTEAIAVLTGHEPTVVSRYADVSFGMTGKHLEMDLAPGFVGGTAETDAKDWGFLACFSPTEFSPTIRDVFGIDLAYGRSTLSYESDPVVFLNEDNPDHVSKHERDGYAARVRFDKPDLSESMGGPSWVWDGFRPLVSLGYAKDHSRIGVSASRYETDGSGFEMTFVNVVSLRFGHYEDLTGQIDGDTRGWGVCLPIGQIAGVRYDEATTPQARNSGLPHVKHKAASGWIDALRIWRGVRSRRSI
jgi:hypothetical protein